MRWHSRAAGIALVAAALCCVLPARDAAARKFQMSGKWVYRVGRFFLPLQFATAIKDSMGPTVHQSMGDLAGAFLFPNGPIPGQGGVTATGSAPATLRIPPHRFVQDAMAAVPIAGRSLVQLTTNIGVDAPYAAATLAPGGGPGSFTWCPGDPACVAGGGMRSTDPPQGAGVRNGRIIYRSGANRFGGAMQLGLRRGVLLSHPFIAFPFQVRHVPRFGSGTTLRRSATGGLGSADAPTTRTVFLARGFATQPTMAPPPFNLILYPGPKVTTMFGVSTTGSGAIYYSPFIAIGPMGTKAAQVTTHYGFGQTTGTVIAQQTDGSAGQDFFTVMGSDARTALGAGNLSLVAGGLSFRTSDAGTTPYASFQKVKLTLAPPIPSLSRAGVGLASALVVLAAGWALRRRLG